MRRIEYGFVKAARSNNRESENEAAGSMEMRLHRTGSGTDRLIARASAQTAS